MVRLINDDDILVFLKVPKLLLINSTLSSKICMAFDVVEFTVATAVFVTKVLRNKGFPYALSDRFRSNE